MIKKEQPLFNVLAHFLNSLWPVCVWGIGMTVLGVLSVARLSHLFSVVMIVWGLLNIYLSIRILFDARLFLGLSIDNGIDFVQLDEGLYQLGLLKKQGEGQATRSTTERLKGTRRLIRYFLLSHFGQTLLLIYITTLS
ncbi:hypothetical protein [Hydromonas duriensis]|uniref:Uncharacterized protein n=1 Tax=Hydromonas duriensis TaxID=1527608 RepID=A0A4R6YBV1_9BURK|nr:hypothetical protein [Hydromonas duriensis]TDR33081.1 hypothetical protein DFR44_101131 [Hydromonas duriensis]